MGGEIIVVGMGPGPVKYLTAEARDTLLAAEEVYFRFSGHPVYQWLRGQGKECVSFDPLYALPGVSYDKVYVMINRTLIKAAQASGRVVYALPGSPVVFEKTPRWLRAMAGKEGVEVKVIVGISFLEMMYQVLEIDPADGVQIINGFDFGFYGDYPFTEYLGLLIGSVGFPTTKDPSGPDNNAAAVMRVLLKKFPPGHKVTLVWSTGMPDYEDKKRTFRLAELPGQAGYVRNLATLYVPPVQPPWEWAQKRGKKPARTKTAKPAKKAAPKKGRKK